MKNNSSFIFRNREAPRDFYLKYFIMRNFLAVSFLQLNCLIMNYMIDGNRAILRLDDRKTHIGFISKARSSSILYMMTYDRFLHRKIGHMRNDYQYLFDV